MKCLYIKIGRKNEARYRLRKQEVHDSYIQLMASNTFSSSPQPATNLQIVSISDTTADLNWDTSVSPGIDSYTVYVENVDTGTIEQTITGIQLTEADVMGLSTDSNYEFWVRAVRDGIESIESNHVTGLTALQAPTGLVATDVRGTEIDIEWDAITSTNLSGYNIYVDGGSGFTKHNSTLEPTESYTVDGLNSETAYDMKITAVNSNGLESDFSSTITETTPDITAPDPPQNVQTLEVETFYIRIGADPSPSSDVVGYNAYKDDGGGGVQDNGGLLTETEISDYKFDNLNAETTYDLWFTAVDDSGNESGASTKVTETTLADLPDAPTNFTVTVTEGPVPPNNFDTTVVEQPDAPTNFDTSVIEV